MAERSEARLCAEAAVGRGAESPSEVSGDVAQTGEHLLCKQGVSGSIPLISTN